jgi:DNA mismatch repair protein MutL
VVRTKKARWTHNLQGSDLKNLFTLFKYSTQTHLDGILVSFEILGSVSSDSVKPLAGIKALLPTTVSQIGSSQVLFDPSLVVKELIDNALDARATAIFVDISVNTIDSIQVKDNGHGIPAEDRSMACRRYCTSKIRDFHDLKQVGGSWLGFRGEALASMAEMSGLLSVTTRVEGEPVAVLLKFGRNGEIVS